MEVCIDSVESAINAEKGGALRLELCGSLVDGGTTPSLGVLKIIKQKCSLPVFVMIRPRGGDFLYTENEFLVMKEDIEIFKEHGADGFVFGILTSGGEVDMLRCKELIDLCSPSPTTFHRAFDMVRDHKKALEDVVLLGFERILTSGLDTSVLEGLPVIKQLISQANGRVIILPGGGINSRNLSRILSVPGITEFHCSARSGRPSFMTYRRDHVHMGGGLFHSEFTVKSTDELQVASMLSTAKHCR